MNRKDRINLAAAHLTRNGYNVETPTRNGIDIIARDGHGITAFIAVSPLRRKYFPIQPFKGTKARESRFCRLTAGLNKWLVENPKHKGLVRIDSVFVADDGRLDHMEGQPHRVGAY